MLLLLRVHACLGVSPGITTTLGHDRQLPNKPHTHVTGTLLFDMSVFDHDVGTLSTNALLSAQFIEPSSSWFYPPFAPTFSPKSFLVFRFLRNNMDTVEGFSCVNTWCTCRNGATVNLKCVAYHTPHYLPIVALARAFH